MSAPHSPSLNLLPVLTVATSITAMLVAVLTAGVVAPTLLVSWRIIELMLGNLLVCGSLGLLAGLLTLVLVPRALWLRVLVAVPLGAIHGALWFSVVARTFASQVADVASALLLGWVLSGISGLVVGLALLPARVSHDRLTHPTVVGIAIGLLLMVANGSFVSVCLLGFLLDDGTVLHTVPHPTAPITALVVSDSCGATCRCTVRVDLKAEHRYVRDVYRGTGCDAEAFWQSPVLLHIQDNDGGKLDMDIRSLGLSVP
jgi:hypothetical protein